MMGGDIQVDSTVGKGSVFTVTLRLRIQEQPFSSGNLEQQSFKMPNYKILLVEDNMINLEIETEILQDLGFSIEIAVNGSVAVEKIKNMFQKIFSNSDAGIFYRKLEDAGMV